MKPGESIYQWFQITHHYKEKLDPDLHLLKKLDPDPHPT
jgi:hypothetical protein